jgi:putative acetyltransferase
MTLSPVIRLETASDTEAVFRVNKEAFHATARGGVRRRPEEDVAALVDELRANGNLTLSLVAEIDGEVAGHVGFSPVTFEPGAPGVMALQLSPLAVLPAWQRRGIGGALIREALARCHDLGVDAVFLLGHPGYYPRFGFRPARELGVHYQDDRDAFMGIELRPGALAGSDARLRLSPEFDRFV